MIVKGRTGTGGPALARYLESAKNDHVELLELRNMDAPSLKAALYQMDALAKGSQCQKHALHVQMRAAKGERLTASHWREAVNRYAEEFGMQEHQSAVVLHHQQDGCTHCHIVFNRVHPETLKAADLWQNYPKHKELARQMEQDWGLRQVSSEKQGRKRNYSDKGQGETEQAQRAGESVHDLRERIRHAWETAENGETFAAALEAKGFTLAQGNRRDFVAVDRHGHPYSIGARTTGARAAKVRAKLADLTPAKVPTLEAVRIGQQEAAARRQQELEAQRQQEAAAPQKPQTTPLKAPAILPQMPARPAQTRGEGPQVPSQASPPPRPASDWQKVQEKPAEPARPLYAPTPGGRLARWKAAAVEKVSRLIDGFSKDYEQQQKGFDRAANLERGEAVKGFNDIQRHDTTKALLDAQAATLAAEMQRQQEEREQIEAKRVWEAYQAEQRATLEAQQKAREEAARRYRDKGFKTHLREELTRQRQQPAHIGATNDNTQYHAPPTHTTGQPSEPRPRQAQTRAQPSGRRIETSPRAAQDKEAKRAGLGGRKSFVHSRITAPTTASTIATSMRLNPRRLLWVPLRSCGIDS